MSATFNFFSAARINGIMQGLYDPRLLPNELVWNQRIPDIPAVDEEIMAQFIGTPLIADIIADDARANIYSYGKFQFETTKIPNIKMGIGMNQTMLNQLDRIINGAATPSETSFFQQYENRILEDVRAGVERRKEVLKISMLCDGYSYDRFGVKLTNVTWGMPADLKVTVSTGWDSTSSTPITDIQTVRRNARIKYGVAFNRITMSTQTFQYIIATTEFQNQARTYGWGFGSIPMPALPLQNDGMLARMLERILGGGGDVGSGGSNGPMTIEFYDARYFTQDQAGVITSAPYLPVNKVLLTNTQYDNNRSAYDFANGNTTEGMVANMVQIPTMGRIPTGPGPIAYACPSTHDLNAPGITYWGAARGFPRKQLKQANACLTVGTFADSVSSTFPAFL